MAQQNQDIVTRLRIQYQGDGLHQAKQDAEGLKNSLNGDSLTKGLGRLEYYLGRVERQFKGLEGVVKRLNQSLYRSGGGGGDGGDGGGGGGGDTGRGGRPAPVSLPPALPNTLAGGLLQALGLKPYFHQGDFQARRYVGAQLGQLAYGRGTHMVGGLASAPFTGISGLQHALQGIPVAGPVAAGGLSVAQAAAQQALAHQRQRAQLGFAFGDWPDAAMHAEPKASSGPRPDAGYQNSPLRGAAIVSRRAMAAAKKSEEKPNATPYSDLGIRYGHDPTSLDRLASQMGQSAGMTVRQLMQRGELEPALAANRAMGLDMGTAGLFARGLKEGLIAKSAAQTLEGAYHHGQQIGLSPSDIAEHLRQQAQSIQSYGQTGIPVLDTSGLQRIGENFAARGGVSANVGAQRASAYVQNVAQRGMGRGPDDPVTFALMRAAGYRGGGLEQYMEIKDEISDPSRLPPDVIQKFLAYVGRDAGGGMAAQIAQNSALQRIGMPMTFAASKRFVEGEGALPHVSRKRGMRLIDAGRGAVTPSVSIDAANQADRIHAGGRLTEAMTTIEKAAVSMASSYAEMAPQLEAFASTVTELSLILPNAIRWIKENARKLGVDLD